jgi:hypothetical protein
METTMKVWTKNYKGLEVRVEIEVDRRKITIYNPVGAIEIHDDPVEAAASMRRIKTKIDEVAEFSTFDKVCDELFY